MFGIPTNIFFYGAAGVAVILLIAIWFIVSNTKKPASKTVNAPPSVSSLSDIKTPESNTPIPQTVVLSKDGVINAVVLDDATRSFGERHVDIDKNKDYGRPVQYFNNLVFYLHRFSNGQIEPVGASPHRSLEHSPGETYEAVNNMEDIRKLFGSRSEKDHTKLWMVLIGIGVALFIAFMASQSKGGG